MTKTLCWIAAGGAVGALARFGVVYAIGRGGVPFPWGTLTVNVAGSLAVGVLVGALGRRAGFAEIAQPFLVVGLLGAFTTFSAFSVDALALWQQGRYGWSAAYVLGSVATSLAAAFAGYRLAGAWTC